MNIKLRSPTETITAKEKSNKKVQLLDKTNRYESFVKLKEHINQKEKSQ